MRKLILLLTIAALPVWCNINAGMQWDVRTTGSDNNGGGYDNTVGSPGTDYSQQASAQIAFTDLVIGSTTTQATSAAHPFSSLSPGNVVNVISGTGCTTGRFEVISVASTTATFDRSLGTAASTCTANLGGSLATPGTAVTASQTNNSFGNVIWVQSGTYTVTAGMTFSGGNIAMRGYASAHADGGTAPLITTSTNSVNLLVVQMQSTAWFDNLSLSNTAATNGVGILNNYCCGNPSMTVTNSTLTGFTNAISLNTHGWNLLHVQNCWLKNSTSNAIYASAGGPIEVVDSLITGGSTDQMFLSGVSGAGVYTLIMRSVIASSTAGAGIKFTNSGANSKVTVIDSTIANNTSDGIDFSSAPGPGFVPGLFVQNSIIYGNGRYGINIEQPSIQNSIFPYLSYVAFGGNTTAATHNLTGGTGLNPITLTANPLNADYSLNATTGGGALLKGTGYPGTFINGTTTGHLDVGAVQSAGGGGAATSGYAFSQ